MPDFVFKGLLNPPSGVEDGLSLGTISRRVEVSGTLSISATDTPDPVDNDTTFQLEFFVTVGVAAQTSLSLAMTIDYSDLGDFEVEPDPPSVWSAGGWTTSSWTWNSTTKQYTSTWTRASHTVSTSQIVLYVDAGTAANHDGVIWSFGSVASAEVPSGTPLASENTTVQVPAVFDATVTSPANASTHAIVEIGVGGDPMSCTVTATASGRNQTNGYVKIEVLDSYGSGNLIDSITTTDLAGWTQVTAWAKGFDGVWVAEFTKATVNIGSYEIDFNVNPSGDNTGDITIRTTTSPPQTSEDAGAGNSITVDWQEAAPSITWDVDATNGWNFPSSVTQWTDFRAAKGITAHGNPARGYGLQMSSGNANDFIGSLNLAPNGSPSYAQAVAGLSRVGVKGDASTANQRFSATGGPNPSNTSYARLVVFDIGSPTTTVREVLCNGAAGDVSIQSYSSGGSNFIRYRENANIVSNGGYSGLVCALIVLDHTNSRARLYTQSHKFSPTFGVGANATHYAIGALSGTWQSVTIVYDVCFDNADAEALSTDANAKKLIEGITNSTISAW